MSEKHSSFVLQDIKNRILSFIKLNLYILEDNTTILIVLYYVYMSKVKGHHSDYLMGSIVDLSNIMWP